jgi:hypothetical protein
MTCLVTLPFLVIYDVGIIGKLFLRTVTYIVPATGSCSVAFFGNNAMWVSSESIFDYFHMPIAFFLVIIQYRYHLEECFHI